MMDIRGGCCGFSKSHSEYFRTFEVVKIRQTFYQPPALKTAERWRAEAPSDFGFTPKAWQLITREPQSPTYRRLRLSWSQSRLGRCGSFKPTEEVLWAWEQTLEIAQALQSRCLVFQGPASFHPSAENRKNLKAFFRKVKREDPHFIWEPRGSWRPEEIREICRESGFTHGVEPFKGIPNLEKFDISVSMGLPVIGTGFPKSI